MTAIFSQETYIRNAHLLLHPAGSHLDVSHTTTSRANHSVPDIHNGAHVIRDYMDLQTSILIHRREVLPHKLPGFPEKRLSLLLADAGSYPDAIPFGIKKRGGIRNWAYL